MTEIQERQHELYNQLARHVWAIILIIAELHLGIKPMFKNKHV